MIILKVLGKLLAIPVLLVTSLMWLVVKAMTSIYGLCYGLLGIGVIAAMILFLAYQEWANVITQIEAMISDEEKHEKPDYEKVQEILDKYGDVEDDSIFSQYIECFRNLLAELILESYDVAAFVYQKRCVEGLTIEEIMKNTRLTREQSNMFVRYFDARQNAVTNKETDTGSIDQTKFH